MVSITLLSVMWCMESCSFKDNTTEFKTLPDDGWRRDMPVKFTPEFSDLTLTYDIELAIRHNTSYEYANLYLVVDFIDTVKTVNRTKIDFELSDSYGNWKGDGFGALYQMSKVIAHDVKPGDVESVVVWQSMTNCDVLKNVTDIGIIISPSKQ